MKKRLLSMLLALVMVLSMLPVTALADTANVVVYRDPDTDKADKGVEIADLYDDTKIVSDDTLNAWETAIYTSQLGYVPDADGYLIEYKNGTLAEIGLEWTGLRTMKIFFGHNAVNGVKPDGETENARIVKGVFQKETVAEFTVTVKSYIDISWQDELGNSFGTDRVTVGDDFAKELETAESEVDTKIKELNEADKTIRYEFLGWDKTGDGEVDAIDTSKVTTSNAAERDGDTYTAIYKKSYLITWVDENGAELDKAYVEEGNTPVYTGKAPSKDGHTFSGWDADKDNVVDVKAGAGFPEAENAVTYQAVYTQNAVNEVTVTFKSDGGSYVDPQTIIVGGTAAEPDEPTKEGHTFKGWLLNGQTFDFGTAITESITLTADWEVNTYTVTLDYNNDEEDDEVTVNYGETLYVEEPKWDGYKFEGWYTEDDELYNDEAIKEDITLTAHWNADTTVKLSKDAIAITYGENVKLSDVLDGVYVGENVIDDKGKIGFDTEIDELSVGEHTVNVVFAGYTKNGITYNASFAELTVTVNKAAADVTVNSQTIKYSELDEMLPLVEKDNVKTIDLLAGLDVHDETYLLGTVQVAMELSELEKALIKSAGIDINNITLEQFKKMLGYLGDSIDSVGGLLEDTNIDMDTIKSLVDTLQSIQAQLPMDSELRIQIVDELKAENIGVYLVGSVVADNNYETALDAGYLIITPNGLKAELSWAETDDNDIITLSKLEGFNLSAEVKLVGSTLEGADASVEEAEKHLEYYYIGVDADGELLLEQTMTEEVGVYAQIAYIANWDNEMYYAMPIARPIIVAPNVADVDILDENGNENYLRAFTYDGSPKSVTVTVDGEENVDGLTVKYIGSDTRVDGWYREEAPTESGVYTVVAIYTEKDDNGNLIKAGGAVGAMVIEPADAEFTLTNDEVCPDGEEHFAKLEDDMGFDYLTIAIDRDRNEAYVNLPDDTAEHIDRIVSMLPAEIEEPLNELLDKYADFDGDVQTSTLKNEVNGLIQKVIDADTSAMAVEYAEKLVALVADELENNEEIKALVEKLQSELDAIQTQIEDKLPDELEDYIKEIVSVGDSSIDVNVEKVEADVKALLDQMKDSIPEEVYNELYEVAENLINAVKNNSTVQELQSQVEDILAKVEELENVDAETIVKGILGAAAGAIDGEELAALVEEVIAKIEARGYVDYAKNLLKDIASMYKGEVDVDGYIDAVENEAKELLNKLKEKVASGDISMDDLEDVESYVDGVLAKIQELVNKIPEGTIIFGSNPSEVGEYDCYAMNISANYKPVFQSATLIIGHDMVAATSKEPTCTEDGYTAEAYCKRCQQYVSETIPALGHDWSETAADNGDGTHTHVCGNDSTHTNVEAHVMGAWVTTVTATTTREGEKRRDCAHCDYYETKTIPMIEEEEEWYEPEVEEPVRGMRYLNKKDHMAYIIGYEDGTVRPNDNITRAEVATIYFRLLEDKVRDKYWSVENPYEDVAVTAWYNTAVSTLHNLGVIVDCETEFRPNDPITRAELAVMAAQFAVIEEYERCSFEDVGKKYWAADEIAIVEAMGWIEGYPDGTFLPDVEISRAEAVTIINRMLERAVKEEDMRDDMVTFSDNLDGRWYFDEIQEAANSHKYKRTTEEVKDYGYCYERWTRILEAPDWALIEQGWYARHAA